MAAPIINTRLHLIHQDRRRYPWLAFVPKLNRDFPLREYMDEARALGVGASLYIEVDVDPEDQDAETALVAGLGAPVTAVIASCRPKSTDFPTALNRIATPFVRGLRRVLHTSPDELRLAPLLTENLRRLAAHSLDLCVLARPLRIRGSACARLLGCAVRHGSSRRAHYHEPGLRPLARRDHRMAALPNVACKVSGVVAYAGADWTAADLRPHVERCIGAFDWDRVVSGSAWPVCTLTADLSRWLRATHELAAGCSESERERPLSLNGRRIYRLDAGAEAAGP